MGPTVSFGNTSRHIVNVVVFKSLFSGTDSRSSRDLSNVSYISSSVWPMASLPDALTSVAVNDQDNESRAPGIITRGSLLSSHIVV